MLVTSIFSFSYNVFTGFLFQSHSKLELLVIGLNWLKHVIVQYSLAALLFNRVNPFPNKPWFLHICSTSLLKTLQEKENLFVMSNFSFSPVLLIWRTSCHFHKIWTCCLQTLSDWKSLEFVLWEKVKLVKFKPFAVDKLLVIQMMETVCDRAGNVS